MGTEDSIASSRYRLFSQRWFWFLILHAVVSQMVTVLLRVNTSYRALEIQLDPAWLAIFTVAFSLFPLLFGITAGRATDHYGERPTLIVGASAVLLAALGFLVYGDTVAGLLGCNMLLGIGHVFGMLGEQSIASKNGPSVQRDRIFGYYTVFVSLGQVLSPMLIGAVSGNAVIPDTWTVFLWTAIIAGILLTVSIPIKSSPRLISTEPAKPAGSILSLFRIPGMTGAILASVVVLTSMDLLLVYLPALGTERHIEAATIGTLLSLRAAASMLSRLSFHALIMWIGRERLIVGSIALAAISVAVLPVEMPLWTMGVTILVAGFVLGLSLPLTLAWVSELSPLEVRSTVISLRLVGNRLGQTIIPSLAGLMVAGVGVSGIFWSAGATLGLIGFTTARAFRRQVKPTPKP
jgi:MFS family permease